MLVLPAVQRPTVNELVRECSKVDWHQLGRHLGIEMHILRDIDLDYQRVDRKRSEMFDSWLRSNPDASWEHIITALEEMRDIMLAGEIAQRHCGRHLTTGRSMASVDEQYGETVTLDEEEHLTGMSSSSSSSFFLL